MTSDPTPSTDSAHAAAAPAPMVRPRFGVRLLALLVDYGLILCWMAVLAAAAFLIAALTGGFADWLAFGPVGAQLLGFLLLVLPVGIYLYHGEASERQATLGKRLLGLRVVSAADGGRASRARVLVRTVVKLLPWELAHIVVWNFAAIAAEASSEVPSWLLITAAVANALPFVYVAVVALQKDGRGPHDLVAGTRVVAAAGESRAPRVTPASAAPPRSR